MPRGSARSLCQGAVAAPGTEPAAFELPTRTDGEARALRLRTPQHSSGRGPTRGRNAARAHTAEVTASAGAGGGEGGTKGASPGRRDAHARVSGEEEESSPEARDGEKHVIREGSARVCATSASPMSPLNGSPLNKAPPPPSLGIALTACKEIHFWKPPPAKCQKTDRPRIPKMARSLCWGLI